jgi:N-hydroxyarylamine O-acetyltransferase
MINVPTDSPKGLWPNAVKAYLQRLGVAPRMVEAPNLEVLAHLQRVHLTTIPFETFAITGDPYGEREGEGIVLAVPHLYTKIVERKRGGYCFELNGLFYALLSAIGYDVHRVAARMVSEGAIRIPANHQVIVVDLDQPFVVDVGLGPPRIREPLPLDGTPRTDEVGVTWRIVASERPDATYRAEYRTTDATGWTPRYVFDDEPRPLRYFDATNDYFQSAPESPFTGEPTIALSTEMGYRKLSGDTFEEVSGDEHHERTVTGDAWHEVLEQKFGLRYRSG